MTIETIAPMHDFVIVFKIIAMETVPFTKGKEKDTLYKFEDEKGDSA